MRAAVDNLEAVEALWNRVLDVRRACNLAIFFYSIIQPNEYNDLFTNPKMQKNFAELTYESTLKKISDHGDIEKCRPLLGETLWYLFHLYSAILGRITYHWSTVKRKGILLDGWRTR
jgi:hypothetical protein